MLETERLLLRDFVPSDWSAVLAYQSDPLYLRYYHWTGRTEEDVRQFVQNFVVQQAERPRTKYQLALVLKAGEKLIGNCGIRVSDPLRREASIGYELDSRYWGQGYATEAAREVMRFGFGVLGMRRLWAECVSANTGSARVLERLGMRREGEALRQEQVKGRRQDYWLYSMVAPDVQSSLPPMPTRAVQPLSPEMIKISIDPILEEPHHALSREDVEAILDVVPGEWTHFVRMVHLSAVTPNRRWIARSVLFSWVRGRLNVASRGLSREQACKDIMHEFARLGLRIQPYKGNALSTGQLKQIERAAAPFLKELEARGRNSASV